jgi:thioesterase domain-containing protein
MRALDRLIEGQILPEDTGIDQFRRYIQVTEAYKSCFQKYRLKLYPGRITLFRGENTEDGVSLWTPFSSEPVEVHTVSGDHILMVVEPYVTSLARKLQQCLDKL